MLTKDKSFYRLFFRLSIVLMLQNIIVISVNLADNIMLGRYSEMALSGAAAVNQIQFILNQILVAAGDAVVIIGSQYMGKGQTKAVKHILVTALRTTILAGLILMLLTSLFPYQTIRIFTDNELIIEQGAAYLSIIRFTYLFFVITMIMEAALRCAEMVNISLYLSILTFFVNCGINYVLIFGKFGAPEMGIKGAAIGTLIARALESVIVLFYAFTRKDKLTFVWTDFLHESKVLRGDYFKKAAPMVLVQGLWGVNTALQTVVLGHMTDSAIAANSITNTVYLLMKSMSVGAASAAAVLIGKTIGSGDIRKVKEYAKTMQVLFLLVGLVSSTILFFIRIPILGMYDLSDETRNMANTFLLLQCLICMGMSYQMPVNNGLIRGGGNPEFIVKMDLISIWVIVLPLSFFTAFVLKASPVVVFCCLNADQIFKCIPSFIKVRSWTWIRILTREDQN